jgi:hypothetical protein
MTLVIVHDAIGADVGKLPAGPAAGYTTGSGPVPWTAAQFAAHPGAVRIDQDPAAKDPTADVLDVENGAATPADCASWVKRATIDVMLKTRPGQRNPAIYTSESNVTAVVNALVDGGVHGGVGLWVASWGIGQAAAEAMVNKASGPYPVIGVQFENGPDYDTSVFSNSWLGTTTTPPNTPSPTWTENAVNALPTLQLQSTGPNVRTLQGLLNARGYSDSIDGVFGPETASQVRSFQGTNGLSVDGIVGPKTWPKLLNV